MIYFVVPVYKVENYLARCVDSIIGQTYNDVHIVLVDDGSPDNCPAICDAYAEKYSNITVIHKENGGLSDARNFGIDKVMEIAYDNDFITFVDSDDFVRENYSAELIGLCQKFNAQVAQCNYEKGSSDKFSLSEERDKPFDCSASEALLNQRLKSQSCAKIYMVSLFKNVRYPKGVLNEDEFTTWKAVFNAEKVVFSDLNLYYYFQHADSIMDVIAKKLKDNPHRFDWLKAYEERIKFFEERNLPDQVLKTKEKICTDVILRYIEQMNLKKEDRDIDCVNGTYLKIYRENYKIMMKRKGMPIKRRLMYIGFNVFPYSSVMMGKIFAPRK